MTVLALIDESLAFSTRPKQFMLIAIETRGLRPLRTGHSGRSFIVHNNCIKYCVIPVYFIILIDHKNAYNYKEVTVLYYPNNGTPEIS